MLKSRVFVLIFSISTCLLQGCSHGAPGVVASSTRAAGTAPASAAASAQEAVYANSLLDRMQAMPVEARRLYAKSSTAEVDYLRSIQDPTIKARFEQLSR